MNVGNLPDASNSPKHSKLYDIFSSDIETNPKINSIEKLHKDIISNERC